MKILGTGLTGLIGSRIIEILSSTYHFDDIRSYRGDITEKDSLFSIVHSSKPDLILHLAAKSDVDACEEDAELFQQGETWRVNVEGTRNVVEAAQAINKPLIYVSTDFVFDGQDEKENGYTEEDLQNPINWYAKTKYEGEKIVQKASVPWIIMRLAFPYRSSFARNDFVRTIIEHLKKEEPISMVEDQIITPTFVDDIAHGLQILIEKRERGIYHVVGSESLSPFDAAIYIADVFGFQQGLIRKIARDVYFAGKAKRPFRLVINNDKIEKLGVHMKTFCEGLQEIKRQQFL